MNSASKVKKQKRVTPSYLRNYAYWYLERYGGTEYRVRAALQRRIYLSAAEHGDEPNAPHWVDELVESLKMAGLINDLQFAQSKVRKGRLQARSKRLILKDLEKAGVDRALADEALRGQLDEAGKSEQTLELDAALAYVRKRHLGPYRPDPDAYSQKDMAALARRGFSYEIARKALNAPSDFEF